MAEIERLLSQHHRMVELFLEGRTQKEVAQEMGYAQASVCQIFNSPLFQHELGRRRKTREGKMDAALEATTIRARDMLAQSAERAAGAMISQLDSPSPDMQYKSASYILDRVLGKQGDSAPQIVIQADRLELLQLALRES